MKEPLIDPMIFFGIGACPVCSTPLVVADKELTVFQLNKDGAVMDMEETNVIAKALCPNCGHRQEMMRDPFNGIYRPYSRAAYLFAEADLKEAAKYRHISTHEWKGEITNPLVEED